MKGVERQLGRGGVRAGMTLVELLIALALMVAVAGLALPNMFSILARSTAEEGRRQALAALASARAEAIGAGEPVRVIAEPVGEPGRGWRLRAVALEPADDAEAGSGVTFGDEERWRPETVAALPGGWILLAPEMGLPGGAPAGAPSASGGSGGGGGGGGSGGSGVEPLEAIEPVQLVTFLPDGGAIAPPSPAVFGAGNQRFALKVDRWSGRARLIIDRGEVETDQAEADDMDEPVPGDDKFGEADFSAGEFDEFGGEDPQW